MFLVEINGEFYPDFALPPTSTNPATIDRRERRKRSRMLKFPVKKSLCELAPLPEIKVTKDSWPKAVPSSPKINGFVADTIWMDEICIKQEGTNPMRYNDNYASASATVATAESDTSVQRSYLLKRLSNAEYSKRDELQKLFNLYVDNTPKNYKDLIAIITAGTYTIDKKIEQQVSDDDFENYTGPLYGIIWPGPVADWDGFHAASLEQTKQTTAARDVIMTSDAAAGLTALQAFEAWLPAPTATAN